MVRQRSSLKVMALLGGAIWLCNGQAAAEGLPTHQTYGPYEVGMTTVHLTDPDRPQRVMFYLLFYPSLETSSVPGSVYGFPVFFLPDLTSDDWQQFVERPFHDGVPVAPGKHGLVVYSHGGGGQPAVHVRLAVIFASHGIVTALPYHDFESNIGLRPAPIGDPLEHRLIDFKMVLDDLFAAHDTPGSLLYQCLDTDWAFAGGWSLGGAASLLASGTGRGQAGPDARLKGFFANDGTREALTIEEMQGNSRCKILFSQYCRTTQQQLHYYTGGTQVSLEGVTPHASSDNHAAFSQICEFLTIHGFPQFFPPCSLTGFLDHSRFFDETTSRYAIAFMRLKMGNKKYRRVLTPGHNRDDRVHFIPTALGQNPHQLSEDPLAEIHAFCSQPGNVDEG